MHTPRIGALNDFAQIAPVLEAAATEFGVSYELLVAQALQESSWKLQSYRYEPGYDRRYISSTKGRAAWSKNLAWLKAGPTCAEWFQTHPQRLREKVPGRDWSFIAQTRIAASYGAFQLMYPTALAMGHLGMPERLYDPGACRLGAKLFAFHYRAGLARGWTVVEATAVALARYNGGTVGNDNPRALRNIEYVRQVDRRFRQCWGRAFLV